VGKLGSITGRDHVVSRYLVQSEGGRLPKGWVTRLLILRLPDGQVAPYWPLYDFMAAKWTRSDTWRDEVARAVGLFWDYCQARTPLLSADSSPKARHRELLRGFSQALVNGTIDEGQVDALGLYWFPQPATFARKVISRLELFAVWVWKETDEKSALLPEKALSMSVGDHMVSAVMSVRRRNMSLLGYLDPKEEHRESLVDLPKVGRGFNRSNDRAISFPPAMLEKLIWEGFLRPGASGKHWGDYDVRSMMIVLLQAYAGMREHEVFHLWHTDIVENPIRPGQASIFMYHPTLGLAYTDGPNGKYEKITRQEKLIRDYDLPSRTMGLGSYKIGWKNSMVATQDYYAVVHWTDPLAAMLFWELYRYYVARRDAVMSRRRALGYGDHPFLFVSEREARSRADGAAFVGAPASIGSYEDALRKAVERIGLTHGKQYGTTSHGLRHFFAYTLKKLGSPRKIIQEGLRHCHPFSQEIYGNPSPMDVSDELERIRLHGGSALPPKFRLSRTFAWIEEAHPEYSLAPLSYLSSVSYD
jgi:hypothetical protein